MSAPAVFSPGSVADTPPNVGAAGAPGGPPVAGRTRRHPALHHQVADVLAYRVGAGVYPLGAQMPGGDAIATELGVSPATVERARNVLVKRGVIRTVPLKGSWIVEELPPDFTPPASEPAVLERTGRPGTANDPFAADRQPLAGWLFAVLRAHIASGRYPSGAKLPSRDELMREYKVGRHTTDEAMRRLKGAGLIWAKALEGTFVRQDLPEDLGPTVAPPRPVDPPQNVHAQREREAGPKRHVRALFGGRSPEQFGQDLRRLRGALDLTQAQAAEQVGIAATTLAELERGYLPSPSRATCSQVAAWMTRVAGGIGAPPVPGDHGPIDPSFGRVLRRARRAAGLTQGELARSLRMGKSTLSQIEGARNEPTPVTYGKLRSWLVNEAGVDPAELDVRPPAAAAQTPHVAAAVPVAEAGPRRYFVAFTYRSGLGREDSNTVFTLEAPPQTLAEVRELEQVIGMQYPDFEHISIRGWQLLDH